VKGFVPTPAHLVDQMVAKLFRDRPPRSSDRLLDPGCGTGAFIEGVLRWCKKSGCDVPAIVGIDSDPTLLEEARRNLGNIKGVTLLNEDFLQDRHGQFDFVIGNPPYVPITGLSIEERARYRNRYRTAVGRFDLYLLFFEQALSLLEPRGRLVLVTPEKFLYTQTAGPLRRRLATLAIEEIHLIDESAFGDLTTYPTVTTVANTSPDGYTRVIHRDGTVRSAKLGGVVDAWLARIRGGDPNESTYILSDAFIRISCGVATGADSVFVMRDSDLPDPLRRYTYPTVSGRSIAVGGGFAETHSMLVPYHKSGTLLAEHELGALGEFLGEHERKARLLRRTCVSRKPWYAFHETPPLPDILGPKILCKDIGPRPWFVVDERGDVVPRHSVYYLVPAESARIHDLCAYLNSEPAANWLMANCQRAANGFVRLQSHVLKRMPIPKELVGAPQLALA